MTAAIASTPNTQEESQLRYQPTKFWATQDRARADQQERFQKKDEILPVGQDLTNVEPYLNRLQPIKDVGSRLAAGQVASTQYQNQLRLEAQQRALQAQQAQSYQDALASMAGVGGLGNVNYQTVQGGQMVYQNGQMVYTAGAAGAGGYSGSSAQLWGSGGAQGVANVLRAAGFPESAIPTMMAIAKAESGWNPRAYNGANRNGSNDAGLFQINNVHEGQSYYPKDRFDPLQSAQAAYAIWKNAGGTYRDWSVYNSGAYRQYLTNNVPPPMNFSGNAGGVQATTVQTGNSPVTTRSGQVRMTAINTAVAYMNSGKGYIWGGNDLNRGVDCSGLVQQAYKAAGMSLPRTAQEQAFWGRKAPIGQLQAGDLVAFNNGGDRGLQVGHIAIYLGNNQIIESYQTGRPARIRSLTASEVNSGYAWGVSLTARGI